MDITIKIRLKITGNQYRVLAETAETGVLATGVGVDVGHGVNVHVDVGGVVGVPVQVNVPVGTGVAVGIMVCAIPIFTTFVCCALSCCCYNYIIGGVAKKHLEAGDPDLESYNQSIPLIGTELMPAN